MLGMGKGGKRVELDVGLIYGALVGFMFRMDLFSWLFYNKFVYVSKLEQFKN